MAIRLHRERVPQPPPTLEDQMGEVVSSEIKRYAPPDHGDRVSATGHIMCDATEKVYVDSAAGLDAIVAELEEKITQMRSDVEHFKEAMRGAADELKRRIHGVMIQFEDLTAKLQQSPFNGTVSVRGEQHDLSEFDAGGEAPPVIASKQ